MAIDSQQELADFRGTSIQEIIGKYLPYWPIFIILAAIGGVLGYFNLRKATPIYQASATIMIKEDQSGEEAIVQQLSMSTNRKNLHNEISILKSKLIAMNVAKALHLYAPITEEGEVRLASAYTTSPVHFQLKNPDSIKSTGPIYFTYNSNNRTVVFDNHAYPLNQYVLTSYGEMTIVPNKYYSPSEKTNPMYFTLVPLDHMAGVIQGNLNAVMSEDESTIVNLFYADESPHRAVDVLNTLVAVYNKAAIEEKNKQATNTLTFLRDRLKFVEDDLDSVESRLANFKSVNQIVDIGTQGAQYLEQLTSNDQRINTIDIQLSVLDEVQKYITAKQQNKDAIVPSTGVISDPILTDLLSRLFAAETEQAQMRATTGENYPSLTAVTAQINRLRPILLENLRNQRQNLIVTKRDLEKNNSRFNSLLSVLPAQEQALIMIRRQQAIKETIYTFLLQKQEEAALTYASQVPDSRLVNDAQVTGIISPNRQNIYIQFIAAGLILATIFVFIRENLNRNIISRSELEKITPIPIIAEISLNKTAESIVVESGNRSLIAEQFRYLRTSLTYIGINDSNKKILFTSSISSEGKSFITTNMGATLALTGKKVVLLEMDLRKPKISEALGLDRNIGLSDYLIGLKSAEEVIKTTPVANLFLISSGAIPPNPAELLMNGKLQELFVHLEAAFDYILVDSAPVSPVTDAFIISPLCDATLYIVRQGKSPRVLVQRLNELVNTSRLKNVAIVFNGVKQKRFGGYYGYGYTYGYGYLDEKSGKSKKKNKSIL